MNNKNFEKNGVTLKNQAVSSVIWTSLQQFGTQAISFLVSIILARILEPKDFGVIALFGIISGVAVLLMSSGMTTSIIRSKNIDEDDLSTVFIFNIVVAAGLYLIIYVSAPWVEKFYKISELTSIVRVYSLIFVIQAFGAVQKTLITKALEFKKLFVIQLPSLVISSLSGILMAYNGFGVWALVYMAIVQYMLDTLQIWIKSDYRPTLRFSQSKFKRHFGFGINMTFTGIITVIFQNLYVIYIGKVFSPTTLGFYNRADSLKSLPVSNIMNVLKRVLVPFFSTINDDIILKSYYKKIISSVIFLLAPILVLMIFQAHNIVLILLTEKWLPVVPYLQILCLSGFLLPLSEYNINLLVVKGHSKLILKLELYKKVIMIVIFVISIYWGIYGLLVGQVFNGVVVYMLNSHYTKKLINYSNREQISDVLPYILVAASAAILPHLLLNVLPFDNVYFKVSAFAILFVLVYLLLCWMFKLDAYSNIQKIYQRK